MFFLVAVKVYYISTIHMWLTFFRLAFKLSLSSVFLLEGFLLIEICYVCLIFLIFLIFLVFCSIGSIFSKMFFAFVASLCWWSQLSFSSDSYYYPYIEEFLVLLIFYSMLTNSIQLIPCYFLTSDYLSVGFRYIGTHYINEVIFSYSDPKVACFGSSAF